MMIQIQKKKQQRSEFEGLLMFKKAQILITGNLVVFSGSHILCLFQQMELR